MNPEVDSYFTKAKKWKDELEKLRIIILSCGLTEERKWGSPCYTLNKKNIVLLHVFKEYCGMLFFKGALLKNKHGILIEQSKNVQAARQIRFTNIEEIVSLEPVLKLYLNEAIAAEKKGLKVAFKTTTEYNIPEEFEASLKSFPDLKTAFEALTPGRQRGYLLHFSAPKQSKTRQTRIEKCIPNILNRKGLNDD